MTNEYSNPPRPGTYRVWELISGKSFEAEWNGEYWHIPAKYIHKTYTPIIDHWEEI